MKIYQKRSLILFYVLGCFLFVLGGIFLLQLSPDDYVGSKHYIYFLLAPYVGWASVIFFGILCLPLYVISFIKPKLMFELLEDGFYSEQWGYVDWKNIENISLKTIEKTKLIYIKTKNVLKKQKYIQNINNSIYGYNCIISLTGTGTDIEEVYKLMLNHLQITQNHV